MHAAPGFDVVIIAGDHLDLSSHVPRPAQIVVVLKYLQRLRAMTTLVTCSGNHDLDAVAVEREKTARWFSDICKSRIVSAINSKGLTSLDDVRAHTKASSSAARAQVWSNSSWR